MTINEYRMLLGAVENAKLALGELVEKLKFAEECVQQDKDSILSMKPEEDSTEHAMEYFHLYQKFAKACAKANESIDVLMKDTNDD